MIPILGIIEREFFYKIREKHISYPGLRILRPESVFTHPPLPKSVWFFHTCCQIRKSCTISEIRREHEGNKKRFVKEFFYFI